MNDGDNLIHSLILVDTCYFVSFLPYTRVSVMGREQARVIYGVDWGLIIAVHLIALVHAYWMTTIIISHA
jgi:hypothetical protein